MKKRTFRIWLATAAALLFALLAACGGESNEVQTAPKQANEQQQSSQESTKQQEAEKEVKQEADEPAELTFYSAGRDSEEAFNDRFGDAVRKKFPHYTIKYIQRVPEQTDVSNLLSSNTTFDLVFDSVGSFNGSVLEYELGEDLTEWIRKHNVDISNIEPSLIEAAKTMGGGKLVGLPVENSTKVIYYNQDIFDHYGVDYPTDGMTWSEFYNLAQRLNQSSEGRIVTGFSPAENHMIIQTPFSLPLVDPETHKSTFHDERWKTIIETELLQFARNDVYQAAMKENNDRIFRLPQFTQDHLVAMFPEGQLLPIVLQEDMSQFNWDIVSMPTYEELPGVGYQSYPTFIAITTISKNKDAAMKVIEFLISEEYQTEMSKKGNMTVLTDENIQKMMGQESYFHDKNYGAFFYNQFAPIPLKSEYEMKINAYAPLVRRFSELARGEVDINTLLREAEEEVNALIQAAMQ